MDQFGPLPVTLAGLEARLREGEALTIEDKSADGFDYTPAFEGERFLLRQGSTVHPFHQVEPAVLTLLCCLGVFRRPTPREMSSLPGNGGLREVTKHLSMGVRGD